MHPNPNTTTQPNSIRTIRATRPWLANAILIGLSGTTLLIIIVATLVSYSLTRDGKTLAIIGDVRGCVRRK
jgi:uncharacterized YccA/Bax inhibitor family protein